MADRRTRRSLLRGGAVAAGAALAGCGSITVLGGGDARVGARDWLYDPTAFADDPVLTFRYESPRRLRAVRDRLHPEVARARATPIYAPELPSAATDWALRVADALLRTPIQTAYGGRFDAATARLAAEAAVGDGVDLRTAPSVAGLDHRSDGEAHVGYREGLAVAARTSAASFERLVTGAADRTDRLGDAAGSLGRVLDALGFDHTARATFAPQDDTWVARGYGYRVDGATTTCRLVVLDDGVGADDLRETGARIDGLREVAVDADGPVLRLTGVADTDRVSLRGDGFRATELPYG